MFYCITCTYRGEKRDAQNFSDFYNFSLRRDFLKTVFFNRLLCILIVIKMVLLAPITFLFTKLWLFSQIEKCVFLLRHWSHKKFISESQEKLRWPRKRYLWTFQNASWSTKKNWVNSDKGLWRYGFSKFWVKKKILPKSQGVRFPSQSFDFTHFSKRSQNAVDQCLDV